MCQFCDKLKLKNAEGDLTEWLVLHEAWEVFDSREEADMMLKAYIDEHVDMLGFDEEYEQSWKKVAQSFRRQQRHFPAKGIIQALFNFRPITKAENDIENFVEEKIKQASSDAEGKAILERLKKIIFGISLSGYVMGGNEALRKIKYFFSRHKNPNVKEIAANIETAFNLTNKDVLQFLENYAAERVSQIDDTTRRILRNTIVEGYKKGKGPQDIAKMIASAFNEFTTTRSKTIAFTELSIAAGEARYQSYTKRNIPFKEWITRGPRPCPVCVGNRAQKEIPMTQEFVSGHLTVPAHPLCMCDIVPRLSEFWCGGHDMAKSVFQSEDRCPGYCWYGGNGNEKTTNQALPGMETEWGKKPKSVMRWKPFGTKAEADSFSRKSKIANTLFHGTPKVSSYSTMKANGMKPSLWGKFGPGIYLTTSKDFAESYAGTEGVVAKTKVSILGKILQADTKQGQAVIQKLIRGSEDKIIEQATSNADFRTKLNDDPMHFERVKYKHYYNQLEKQGYSAVAFGTKGETPKARYKVEELVVFNKENIMIYE